MLFICTPDSKFAKNFSFSIGWYNSKLYLKCVLLILSSIYCQSILNLIFCNFSHNGCHYRLERYSFQQPMLIVENKHRYPCFMIRAYLSRSSRDRTHAEDGRWFSFGRCREKISLDVRHSSRRISDRRSNGKEWELLPVAHDS